MIYLPVVNPASTKLSNLILVKNTGLKYEKLNEASYGLVSLPVLPLEITMSVSSLNPEALLTNEKSLGLAIPIIGVIVSL